MFRCELLLAWDDGTWTTDVFSIPERFDGSDISDSEIEHWFMIEGPGKRYSNLVKAAVYSLSPEEPMEPDTVNLVEQKKLFCVFSVSSSLESIYEDPEMARLHAEAGGGYVDEYPIDRDLPNWVEEFYSDPGI